MIERATSTASIASMLKTLEAHRTEAGSALPVIDSSVSRDVQGPSFGDAVTQALQQVNGLQMKSTAMQQAYEQGENIPLTEVVMSMQKSSIAFEATLQIRNKVLKAYQDILNMPV